MADVDITPVETSRPVPSATLTARAESAVLNAPTDEWTLANDGRVLLQFVNDHATQDGVVTVVSTETVDGLAVADRDYTVPATETTAFIGPFPVETYGTTLTISATAQGTLRLVAMRAP